jgi:RNA recognition motif-containing protein
MKRQTICLAFLFFDFKVPREEANNDEVHLTVKKIFIGGIRDGLDEDTLKNYFEKFGHVNDCFLMHDKDGKTRGFAFLEFDGKLKLV